MMPDLLLPQGIRPPDNTEPDRFEIELQRDQERIGWRVQIRASWKGLPYKESPSVIAIGWGAAIDRAHELLEQLRPSFKDDPDGKHE